MSEQVFAEATVGSLPDRSALALEVYENLGQIHREISNLYKGLMLAPRPRELEFGLEEAERCAHFASGYVELASDLAQSGWCNPAAKHIGSALTLISDLSLTLDKAKTYGQDAYREAASLHVHFLRHALSHVQGTLELLGDESAIGSVTPTKRDPEKNIRVPESVERLICWQITLLPIPQRTRYAEELRAELHDLTQAGATKAMLFLYAFQQITHVVALRAAIQSPSRPRLYRLHKTACWMLASDWRTWGLLGPVMAVALVNVLLQQGWGSAFYTIPAVVAFYAGVEWLRNRWGVSVKARRRGRKSTE
ncbi:hypothetical protein ACIA8R_43745 [Nonomuraea sp. NPDC051191]|uniref:hypothetical protein n=1 Tax=Nonomuraea sp. NPDC051191 TaxID=3364372 RepID=UPI0037B10A58